MIIAIGGCSNSGKSALAKGIAVRIKDKPVKVLCQDDFTHPTHMIPKIKGHTDWEIPASIDFGAMKHEIEESSKNNDIVIVEGLMIYYLPELNKLYDKKLFVNINKKTFLKRKYSDFRWGKEPDWYVEHIWNNYLKYGQPPKEDALIIDGTKEFNIDKIISKAGIH